MRAIAAIAAAALLALGAADAEDEEAQGGTTIPGGFTSGRDYVDMPGQQKSAYVAGLMDGMLLSPAFGGSLERMGWFLGCTDKIGVTEMREAINDYMFAHSDEWDRRNPAKFYRAILARCEEHFRGAGNGSE